MRTMKKWCWEQADAASAAALAAGRPNREELRRAAQDGSRKRTLEAGGGKESVAGVFLALTQTAPGRV